MKYKFNVVFYSLYDSYNLKNESCCPDIPFVEGDVCYVWSEVLFICVYVLHNYRRSATFHISTNLRYITM